MKTYLTLLLIIFVFQSLKGQEKETIQKEKQIPLIENVETPKKTLKKTPSDEKAPMQKTRIRKKRIPDSEQPDYLNFQFGFAANVLETVGINATLTFEHKIENLPLAWFANYTFGYVSYDSNVYYTDSTSNNDSEPIVYTSDETEYLSITYHHFGGGLHYYFREYNRKLKLYTGLGAFIGVNHHEKEYETDGSIDDTGFDFGVYTIFGIRWCRRHVKVGFEYRIGYAHTTLFDDAMSGDMHELCFCIGVQF